MKTNPRVLIPAICIAGVLVAGAIRLGLFIGDSIRAERKQAVSTLYTEPERKRYTVSELIEELRQYDQNAVVGVRYETYVRPTQIGVVNRDGVIELDVGG